MENKKENELIILMKYTSRSGSGYGVEDYACVCAHVYT